MYKYKKWDACVLYFDNTHNMSASDFWHASLTVIQLWHSATLPLIVSQHVPASLSLPSAKNIVWRYDNTSPWSFPNFENQQRVLYFYECATIFQYSAVTALFCLIRCFYFYDLSQMFLTCMVACIMPCNHNALNRCVYDLLSKLFLFIFIKHLFRAKRVMFVKRYIHCVFKLKMQHYFKTETWNDRSHLLSLYLYFML